MVIKRQIQLNDSEEEIKDIEIKREKFIMAGGLVASDVKKPVSNVNWTKLCLRIKVNALEQIDDIVLNKLGGNRTTWILEAIEEKLKREV